jgi:hypothetical protein
VALHPYLHKSMTESEGNHTSCQSIKMEAKEEREREKNIYNM